MRANARSVALIGLLVSIAAVSAEGATTYRLVSRFERSINPGTSFLIADTDGDGNDDVLEDNGLWLTRWRLHGYAAGYAENQGDYLHKGVCVGTADATGDRRAEFFVHMKRPDGQYLAVHDWYGPQGASKPIRVLGPFLPPRPESDPAGEGTINFFGCDDVTGDAIPDMLVGIVTYKKQPLPRSFKVFCGASGKRLWSHDMGPQPHICKVAKTRAGKRVMLATFAPDNGEAWNGTPDSCSYLFSFACDHSSHEHKRISGRQASHCIDVADIDGDGFDELIVGRSVGPDEELLQKSKDRWTVAIFDPVDLRMRKQENIGMGVCAVRAADLDRDLVPEILVIGMDGRFYIRNSDLSKRSMLRDRFLVQHHCSIIDACDLNRDGSKEIVLMGTGGVIVLDESGELIAEEKLPWPYQADVAMFEEQQYVVVHAGNIIRGLVLEEAPPAIVQESEPSLGEMLRGSGWVLLAAGGAAGAGLAAAIVLGVRRGARGSAALAVDYDANDRLLVAMTAFGHGASSLRLLDRLQFYLKNWSRTGAGGLEGGETFGKLVADFESVVVPEIRQVAFLSRRARVPRRSWQALAGRALEADRFLRLTRAANAGTASTEASKTAASALGALEDLNRMIGDIRRYLRATFATPIVPALGRIVARRQADLDRKECRARLQVAGAYGDTAFVSPVAFEKIFDGLIDNAIEAIGDARECVIEVNVADEGGSCIVDVRDTGRGIAAADWERVFDRHYTTKPEGGFGLHFAREELAKYGGKIFVHASDTGLGTTMRVILRKSEER